MATMTDTHIAMKAGIIDAVEKINSYIADYGKKHYYKMILGATMDGNILYADEQDDLTQNILKDLNDIYEKKYKD